MRISKTRLRRTAVRWLRLSRCETQDNTHRTNYRTRSRLRAFFLILVRRSPQLYMYSRATRTIKTLFAARCRSALRPQSSGLLTLPFHTPLFCRCSAASTHTTNIWNDPRPPALLWDFALLRASPPLCAYRAGASPLARPRRPAPSQTVGQLLGNGFPPRWLEMLEAGAAWDGQVEILWH